MKIFFCDNRLGGLLGFRAEVIRHFLNQGHEVGLLAPKPVTDWDKVGDGMIQGVKFFEMPMEPSGTNLLKDLRLYREYKRIFQAERPDIIFNYTIKPNIYSSLAAHSSGCRIICMMAGLGYMFNGHSFARRMGRFVYKQGLKLAERVFVLNQSNYDYVKGRLVDEKKLIWLQGGEGVDLKKYAFRLSDFSQGYHFLMVARVLYDKGYSEFVETARIVKSKHPDTTFELLGPIDSTSPMGVPAEVIENDVFQGHIQYLGVRNSSVEILSRPNVVMVLPSSYGEGLNRSLMEACSTGCPIIATNIPGCRETVEDGLNGFLVAPKNVGELSEAIERFIALPTEKQQAMSRRSRQIAEEKFDIQTVIQRYDRIVNSPLSSHLRR